jgi:hypothetical protein
VYFAPTAEQPRTGVHRRCPHCLVPEEEWLSRRSHHTAQTANCSLLGTTMWRHRYAMYTQSADPSAPEFGTSSPALTQLQERTRLSPPTDRTFRRLHLGPRSLSLHLSSEITTAPSGILLSSPSLPLVSTITFILNFRARDDYTSSPRSSLAFKSSCLSDPILLAASGKLRSQYRHKFALKRQVQVIEILAVPYCSVILFNPPTSHPSLHIFPNTPFFFSSFLTGVNYEGLIHT